MNSEEINKEYNMTYGELCQYLLAKYGPAKYDYFVNESCKTKNRKVPRTSEGLICHHIDEDKAIKLSDTKWALQSPFRYQKADRLVYCNALEHLLLHIRITEEANEPDKLTLQPLGIGGAIVFIIPELNLCYSGYEYKRQYEKDIYSVVAGNFDDYIQLLKRWRENTQYPEVLTPERLSRDIFGKIVDRVYQAMV